MNQTELKTVQKVASKLAQRYTFGYYDVEDIEQEAYILAIEAIPKYDSSQGSLENFLYTHLNYKLQNLLRRKYYRRHFECKLCGGKDPNCEQCDRRRRRFLVKKHLLEPIDIDHVNCDHEPNSYYECDPLENMQINELFIIINKHLEIELRIDYLKMLEGITVPKARRDIIEQRILDILEEYGYEREAWRLND